MLRALSNLPAAARYWIAYSGGLDSHVLLHALAALRRNAMALHAVHVDHGLQAQSKQWSQRCVETCAALHVPCTVLAVHAAPRPGESPEDAARRARYAALAELIQEGDCLLTAHHQDDQAETLLLQLLRGAGPRGLAAMPQRAPFARGWHARPLLEFTRADLHAYATQQGLTWIDDQSNFDTGFDRNYLRHEIMPRLRARWPAAARTLARSASHAAQAARLLDALADIDFHTVAHTAACDALSVTALRALDETRQRNVLRYWLHRLSLPLPNAAHIEHILHDVIDAARDKTPRVHWPGAEVRRYRDALYAMPELAPHDARRIIPWDMRAPLELPGVGRLEALRTHGAGIKESLLNGAITVRFRHGGERCQPAGRAHTHELKKLFQERGIPPWRRARVPLIYINDQLAMVGDLWVCAPYQASDGEAGRVVRWEY